MSSSDSHRLTSVPSTLCFPPLQLESVLATIRDLVGALRGRDGVDAAIVLGRDGLVIDGQSVANIDVESVAALVPSIVSAADEFGRDSKHGNVTTVVLEYAHGLAIVSVLSAEAMLLVLARADANVGSLLFELRRNRQHISSLV